MTAGSVRGKCIASRGRAPGAPFASIYARPDLVRIGEPHRRGLDTRCGQRRRTQHVERRLDRRQVEREMRPLFDDAEKHHLAAGEPLLAHTKNLGNALRGVRTAASRKIAEIVTDTYRHRYMEGRAQH